MIFLLWKKKICLRVLLFVLFASTVAGVVHAGNIDATWHTARFLQDGSEIEFGLANGNVTVTDSAMTGYAWAENAGWITFVATTASQYVVNDGTGNLSGYAWGEGTGWVNFNPTFGGVTIDSDGYFQGYAWSQKKGWIVFNCSTDSSCGSLDHKVRTSWRPVSGVDCHVTNTCGSGDGDPGPDVCPNLPGSQATIPSGRVIDALGNCVTPQACQDLGTTTKQSLDIVIGLDRSGSMIGSKLSQAKIAANTFIDSLSNTTDRVSLVSFANTASLDNGLSSNFTEIKNKVNSITAWGGTNIGAALNLAKQEINANGRVGVKKVVIILTDGEPTVGTPTPTQYSINQANVVKIDGITIYTIGLGSGVNGSLLTSLATLPSYYYYAPTTAELTSIYLQIAAIECTAAPSTVSGSVIYDQNGNGIYDIGEVGLSGATITLISTNFTQPTNSIVNGGNGSFSFTNVPAGPYSVCETEPVGYVQTFPANHGCFGFTIIQGLNQTGLTFLLASTTVQVSDVCPNIVGAQTVVPNGMIVDIFGNCIPISLDNDFCPNINGIQTEVPLGMMIDQAGNCVPLPLTNDICPNISGVQTEVPQGMVIDAFGGCVPVSSDGDYCPNISGIQRSVPSGMIIDQNGNCVLITLGSDVCPNINGVQTEVPLGMYIDQSGNCTESIVGTSTPIITNIINIGSGFLDYVLDRVGNLPTSTPVVVATQAISLAGLVLSAFTIPWAALLNSILIFFAFRRREKPWGTVYDSVTKQPLDPAYVTLLDAKSGEEKSSAITDIDGRYGFLTVRGIYKMFSKKTNYVFPSAKLTGRKNDEVYNDLYFGEEINITDSDAIITKNIPMDSTTFDWNEFAKRDKKLLRYYSKWDKSLGRAAEFFFIFGIFTALYNVLVEANILNNVILGLYGILVVVRSAGFRPRSYGTIVDKVTGIPLSFAVVRVMSANFPVEIAHAVADVYGKYYCLVPNGSYKIIIDRKEFGENYTRIYSSGVVEVRRGIIRKHFKV